MPNYNSQLQNNNTDLQQVLQLLQNKASGTKLPELTNPADTSDLLAGKELIGQDGKILTGSMPNNGVIEMTIDGIDIKTVSIPAGYTSGGAISLDSTIDEEVEEQSDLIEQIKNVANSLPEAESGSGGNAERYSVNISAQNITLVGIDADGNSIRTLIPRIGYTNYFYANSMIVLVTSKTPTISGEASVISNSNQLLAIRINGNCSISVS